MNEKKKSAPAVSLGAWIDTLSASIGKIIRIETRTGIQRSGRITGLRANTIKLNGVETKFVTEVELNGDRSDTIPLSSLIRVDIDG